MTAASLRRCLQKRFPIIIMQEALVFMVGLCCSCSHIAQARSVVQQHIYVVLFSFTTKAKAWKKRRNREERMEAWRRKRRKNRNNETTNERVRRRDRAQIKRRMGSCPSMPPHARLRGLCFIFFFYQRSKKSWEVSELVIRRSLLISLYLTFFFFLLITYHVHVPQTCRP